MFKSYLLPTMVIVIEVTHETENQYQWLSNIKNKSKRWSFENGSFNSMLAKRTGPDYHYLYCM